MSIIGSRDTSQGRWEWPVAVIWLPAFVARLVRQVRLIPTGCVFVFSTSFFLKPPTLEKLSPGRLRTACLSRDTSQGRWEWPVAVIWLPAFVARLVRQVRLIPVVSFHVKENQESAAQREVACTESGWPFVRFQLANYVTHLITYMLGTTNKLSKFWGCGYSYT